MPDFFPEVHLERQEAEAIARGLYAVARVDGLHEREAGLIASFWIEAGGGAGALSDLERSSAITPVELASTLRSEQQRQLFIKTAILLTWADGEVTDAERKSVHDFAAALQVDDATLDKLEAGVKDFLLGHLVHLQNVEAASEVARKMKV
jgi:tellurite resistance protein